MVRFSAWFGVACLCFIASAFARAPEIEVFQWTDSSVEISIPAFITGAEPPDWEKVLNPDGSSGVSYGIRLMGPSPYSRNARTLFVPASNTKLFTTAAVIKTLGPDFRFTTRVEWSVQDLSKPGTITGLILRGDGDPTWGMQEFGETLTTRFDQIARALRAKGVRTVRGAVRTEATDPRWTGLRYPEGWREEDYTRCYAALPQAFNLQGNCAFFSIGGPGKGTWVERDVPVPVKLKIRRGKQTELRVDNLDAVGGVTGQGFVVSGTWNPADLNPERLALQGLPIIEQLSSPGSRIVLALPIHRSTEWARRLFVRALTAQGIRVPDSQSENAPAPRPGSGQPASLDFSSPRLAEIIRPLNKDSINFLGEILFRALGARHLPNEPDLLTAGQAAMRDFIATLGETSATALGLTPMPGYYSSEVKLLDGSGLSHGSFVTTGAVMALLMDLARSPHLPAVWDSLPIAGVDGTLASRMRTTPAHGLLRGKTGTLRGVYNLSGYVPRISADAGNGQASGRATSGRLKETTTSGLPLSAVIELIPFVALSKATPGERIEAQAAQDRVGAALTLLVNPWLRPQPPGLLTRFAPSFSDLQSPQ